MLDPEVVRRLKELLAIDHDEIGSWSIREMQDLARALLADWERRGEALLALRAAHDTGDRETWEEAVRLAGDKP